MTRKALSTGGWFNESSAISFGEDTYWDGNNHISKATGSQWAHEQLYYTKGGGWVMNSWSAWQGTTETYCQIDEDAAVEWLIANEYFAVDELPPSVQKLVQAAIQSQEV